MTMETTNTKNTTNNDCLEDNKNNWTRTVRITELTKQGSHHRKDYNYHMDNNNNNDN